MGEQLGYVDLVVTLDAPGNENVNVRYNSYADTAGYSDFEENDGWLTFPEVDLVCLV